jgi:hypothetical protein
MPYVTISLYGIAGHLKTQHYFGCFILPTGEYHNKVYSPNSISLLLVTTPLPISHIVFHLSHNFLLPIYFIHLKQEITMSSLCTPLTLHHLRLDYKGYPYGAEGSLDNASIVTTAFVDHATNVSYYNANTDKVNNAKDDNNNANNDAVDNDNTVDNDVAHNNNDAADDDAADENAGNVTDDDSDSGTDNNMGNGADDYADKDAEDNDAVDNDKVDNNADDNADNDTDKEDDNTMEKTMQLTLMQTITQQHRRSHKQWNRMQTTNNNT